MPDLLNVVVDALTSARKRFHESIFSGRGTKIRGKGAFGDHSYEFDLATERAVIDVVTERLENVAIISEELGISGPSEPDYYVVIDPVDGSKNALRGIPFYSTTVAISKTPSSRSIVAGGVIDLSTGEIYAGDLSGRVIVPGGGPRLSDVDSLEEAYLVVNTSSLRDKKYGRWAMRIIERAKQSTFHGSTALEISYILSGRIDGYVCLGPNLRPLDFVAPLFLLKLSGGHYKILTRDGEAEELDLSAGKDFGVIAASNERLILEIIQRRVEENQS